MKYSVAIAIERPYKRCPFLFVGDIYDSAKKAQALGYDAVELHIKSADMIDREKLLDFCSKTGMKVSSFATGTSALFNKVCFIDDLKESRDKAVQLVCDFITEASYFNAGIIIGDMRGNLPENGDTKIYYERLNSSMSKILEAADKKNVTILMETINRYEKNYLNTVEDLMEYNQQFKSPNLKIHLDLYHMNIEEANMYKAIRLAGDQLAHLHLADNNRLYCGGGALDFKKIIDTVKEVGFKGYYTLECLPIPDGETAARKSIQYLRGLYPES